MPSMLLRWMLFVSSYFPLTIIFCLLLLADHQPVLAIAAVVIGCVGAGLLLLYLYSIAPRLSPVLVKVTRHRSRDDQVMSYITSYLLPFVALPLGGWQMAASLLIFIAVLGWVYVHSGMLFINPVLNLLGYHLYEITVEDSDESLSLLARHRVSRGESLLVIALGDGMALEKKGRRT